MSILKAKLMNYMSLLTIYFSNNDRWWTMANQQSTAIDQKKSL